MNYTKEVTLWCDADDCPEWVGLNNHETKGGKVTEARIAARVYRWTHVDGKDYCKKHSTLVAKVVPDPMFDGPTILVQDIVRAARARAESRDVHP